MQDAAPWGLSLMIYHICDAFGSRITQAIWAARIGGFNLMSLTDTKITDQSYCQKSMGYNMVCLKEITTEEGNAQEGVEMIVWDQPQG